MREIKERDWVRLKRGNTERKWKVVGVVQFNLHLVAEEDVGTNRRAQWSDVSMVELVK